MNGLHRRLSQTGLSFVILIVCLILAMGVSAQTDAPNAEVTVWRLNVRQEPGTQYDILTRISFQEIYPVVGRNAAGTWLLLKLDDAEGWVSARYVEVDDTSVVPVVTTMVTCAFQPVLADECPDRQDYIQVTAQRFEHGTMLWLDGANGAMIYVLYDYAAGRAGGGLRYYVDDWNGQSLAQLDPPPGLQQPQLGFGNLWLREDDLQQSLGWATAPEQAYFTTIEYVPTWNRSPSGSLYLRLAGSEIVRLTPQHGLWQFV